MTGTKQLGEYEIIEELGKGGFATVYRAVDTTLEREVALKVLDPLLMRDPTWVARFQREARAVARLKHPNIVTVYEIGEVEGMLYIAMELVDGPSLKDRITQGGRLSWGETVGIVSQVADALDYAHGEGVLHRDLKPGNILLDPRRGAVLSDFGFAKLVGESSMSVSASGGVVGTPAYIAPETWDGEKAMPQTDLYALGCIVYEMLSGEVLFSGDTPSVVIRKHLLDGPHSSKEWPEGVPEEAVGVLLKALAKEPRARYDGVIDFAQALAECAPISQSRPALAQEAGTPVSSLPRDKGDQHPMPTWLRVVAPAGLVLMGILLGMLLFWVLFPVEWTDAHSYDLSPAGRAEYIALVADSYISDRDWARADRYLDYWEPAEKQQAVADAIAIYEAESNQQKVYVVQEFAMAFGIPLPDTETALPETVPQIGLIERFRLPCLVFFLVLLISILGWLQLRYFSAVQNLTKTDRP